MHSHSSARRTWRPVPERGVTRESFGLLLADYLRADRAGIIIFALILLLSASLAHSQNVRWDLGAPGSAGVVTTSAGSVLVALGNVQLAWCNYPANAVPCTNFANTYPSITSGSACPTNAQIVLQGSNACVATSDAQGNLGVFTAPNSVCVATCYAFTLTANGTSYGPYLAMMPGGGSASGVTGSGIAGQLAVWTGSTSIGSSGILASSSQVYFGNSPSLTGKIAFEEDAQYNGGTCTDTFSIPYGFPSCSGYKLLDQAQPSSDLGYMGGVSILSENTLHNTSKLIGIFAHALSGTSGTTTDEFGGYIFAEESTTTTVTNRHGLSVLAYNDTPNTSALNEGVVVQTGGNGGGTSTTDYSVHILAPANGETLTTHAGIEVDAQATGVPLQLKPVGFATLPACSATYEGSQAAVSDANVGTWGTTITAGSSTNHVLAYCDGTNWTVAGK